MTPEHTDTDNAADGPPRGCPRAVQLAGRGMPSWGDDNPCTQSIEYNVLSAVTQAFGSGADGSV